jgi:hypothetical protein
MRLAYDSLRCNLLYCRSYYGVPGTWGPAVVSEDLKANKRRICGLLSGGCSLG